MTMIALGSGGAITGEAEILDRLPYAKGLQYIALFQNLRGIETVAAQAGGSIADVLI